MPLPRTANGCPSTDAASSPCNWQETAKRACVRRGEPFNMVMCAAHVGRGISNIGVTKGATRRLPVRQCVPAGRRTWRVDLDVLGDVIPARPLRALAAGQPLRELPVDAAPRGGVLAGKVHVRHEAPLALPHEARTPLARRADLLAAAGARPARREHADIRFVQSEACRGKSAAREAASGAADTVTVHAKDTLVSRAKGRGTDKELNHAVESTRPAGCVR